MAFRFKSMGYKMKPSSFSPLRQTDPVTSTNNKKQAANTKIVESINEEEIKKTLPVATDTSSDYNPTTIKSGEDPKTGYYNPFETLAKVILTPDTERAKQRVKERQEKRISKLEAKGDSPKNTKKIERVKARQADERKLRKIDK